MQDFTTSMNPPDHIWVLASKSLQGIASAEEQEQLDNFTRLHPEFYYTLQILSRFWKPNKDEEGENEYELPKLKFTSEDESFNQEPKSLKRRFKSFKDYIWKFFK